MERQPDIWYQSLTEAEHLLLSQYFADVYNEARKRYPKEARKKPKETRVIKAINQIFRHELKQLGLKARIDLTPAVFHLFNKDEFHEQFPEKKHNSSRLPYSDAVIFNRSAWAEPELVVSFIHESLETLAYRAYVVKPEHMGVWEYRSGYLITHPSEDEHFHFYGFHDAIVERYTREIYLNYYGKLASAHPLPPRGEFPFTPAYNTDLSVLNAVTHGVARKTGEPEDTIWWELKQGLFTGNILPLRKVEQAFGPGSLRVLGAWESASIRGTEDELDSRFLQYFQTRDPQERENIALGVLNERERFRFLQRRT